jgi:hypothetical protein
MSHEPQIKRLNILIQRRQHRKRNKLRTQIVINPLVCLDRKSEYEADNTDRRIKKKNEPVQQKNQCIVAYQKFHLVHLMVSCIFEALLLS